MNCKFCNQEMIELKLEPGFNLKKCFQCQSHSNVKVLYYFSDDHEYRVYVKNTDEMEYVLYLNYEMNTTRFETNGKKLTLANQNEQHFNINYTLDISPEEFLNRIPTWLLFS